jgi:hypothetical protein
VSEYANEPVRGLPGHLPAGEYIVWQGSPAWLPIARRVFHAPLVGGYFAVLIGWALIGIADGHRTLAVALPGIGITAGVGAAAVALLAVLGWLSARATIYTITNRRIVLRFGIALPKCVNLPFTQIVSAGLKVHADGSGDVPLAVKETRLGFIHLWPNVRPWRIGTPEPMLRGLAEPEHVARLLTDALLAAVPGQRGAVAATAAPGFVTSAVAA